MNSPINIRKGLQFILIEALACLNLCSSFTFHQANNFNRRTQEELSQCNAYSDCYNCTFALNNCGWESNIFNSQYSCIKHDVSSPQIDNSADHLSNLNGKLILDKNTKLCANTENDSITTARLCGTTTVEIPAIIQLPSRNDNRGTFGDQNTFCMWKVSLNSTLTYLINFTKLYFDGEDYIEIQTYNQQGLLSNIVKESRGSCISFYSNSTETPLDIVDCSFEITYASMFILFYFTKVSRKSVPFILSISEKDSSIVGLILIIVFVFGFFAIIINFLICIYRVMKAYTKKAANQANENGSHGPNNREAAQLIARPQVQQINEQAVLNSNPSHPTHVTNPNTHASSERAGLNVLCQNQIDRNAVINSLFDLNFKPIFFSLVKTKYESVCTICMEKFLADSLVSPLKCQHIFHSECLRSLLKSHLVPNKCPNCNLMIL